MLIDQVGDTIPTEHVCVGVSSRVGRLCYLSSIFHCRKRSKNMLFW